MSTPYLSVSYVCRSGTYPWMTPRRGTRMA
jgi:hypothetical protein